MSLKNNLKLLRGGRTRAGKSRRASSEPGLAEYLGKSRLVAGGIFIVTVAAIVLISYVGVGTTNLPVIEGQIAPVSIVADEGFSHVSRVRTEIAGNALRDRVPPVYRLDSEPFERFEAALTGLLARLDQLDREFPENAPVIPSREEIRAGFVDQFNAEGSFRVAAEDMAVLHGSGDAEFRRALAESGLAILRELYLEGVHDGTLTPAEDDQSQVTVYDVRRQGGEIAARTVQSLEQALTYLRINLTAEGAPAGLTTALYRIFRSGIMPNIVYDEEASRERESEALRALQPVTVNIAGGQTLIEAGSRVTVAQAETLAAYRQHVLDRGDLARDETLRLAGRVLLVLAMVIACAFYVRLEDRETLQSNTRLGLLALVVILNLGLVRANYSLLDLGLLPPDSAWAAVLPFIAPTAIAPLIVAILIDAGSAIFMALLISIFTAVIYGNRMDLLVITFLASMVAIFCCRDARKRGNVVRAAATGGLTVAAFALLVGLVDRTPVDIIGRQMAAGLVTGIVTGVIVVGVIPILESLFQRTTDITLLELTDFNHPLLRLMQLEAPGTYHHSLVVAQLAENACSAIGANPLLARVCALFHDIGKTAKPAYFTENQRDGVNPHDASSPELSAELIKSHVSEGVELAHRHRLPRAVVDVIEQHHGTSLIRYFYHRALGGSRPPQGSAVPFPAAKAQAGGGPGPVSESDYRYDGPKPRFKESAVISLADCVEAASRSLRKPSPQGLSEMIDAIIRDRIADGQLDEAPLTFSELAQVKNSFTFTLLNMLHARVAYPEADAEGAPAGNASGSKT